MNTMALITNCHHRHEQHQHQKQHHSHQHEHPHHRENLLYSSPHERVRQARGQIVSSLGSSPQILKVSTDEAKVRPGLSELQLSVEKIRRGGEASASPREETPSFACCCSAIALRGKIIHCRSRINRASSNYVSPYTTVMVTLLISLFVCNLVNLSSSDSPSNSFEQQQYLHQQQNSPSGVHFDGKNVKSSSSKSSQQQQTSDSFVRRTLSPRTVKIKYGSLRGSLIALGTFSPGQNVKVKGYIEVFQGIPYATPPIASLRFMPPVTPAYWKGTKLCTKFAPVCPQILPRLVLRFNSTSSSSSTLTNSNNNSGNNNSNNNFNTSDCLSFLLKFTSINSVKGAKNQSKNKQNTSSNFKPSNDVNSSKTESNVATLCHRQLLLERISSYLNEQSEDCLYLNLFLPYPTSALNGSSEDEANLAKRRLAVLLLIHGHSLLWGSGNPYDGSILAFSQELIVVTVNYRLGAFGFLSISSADRTRGNFGLFDVIAVLQWIRDNIRAFGGDPDRVTIAGHGLGAEFVNLLLLSPLARGLFSRAILMSGSALNPLLLVKNTTEHSLGLKLNCNSVKSPSECLKSKSTDEIQAALQSSLADFSAIGQENFYLADPFRLASGAKSFQEAFPSEDNQEAGTGGATLTASNSPSTGAASDVSFNGNSFGPIVDGLVIPSNPSHLLKELEISSVGNVNNRSRSIRSTQNESNVHTLLANNSPSNGSFIQREEGEEGEHEQVNKDQDQWNRRPKREPPLPPPPLPSPSPSPSSSSSPSTSSSLPQPPLVKSLGVTNMTNESTQVSLQIRFSSMSILPVGEMGQIEMPPPMASLISSSIPSVSLPPLKRGPAIGTHDLLLGVNGLNSIDFFTKSEFENGHVNEVKASQWLQSLFPTHPLEVILRALINEPLDMPSDSILATLSSPNSDKRSMGPATSTSSSPSSSASRSSGSTSTWSALNASSTPSRNPSSIEQASPLDFSSSSSLTKKVASSGGKSGLASASFNNSASKPFWLPLVDAETGQYLVQSLSSFIYNFLTVTPLVNLAKSYSSLSSALTAQASGKVYFYHFSYENKLPFSDFNSSSSSYNKEEDDSSWFTFNEVNSSSVLLTGVKTTGPVRPNSNFTTGQRLMKQHQAQSIKLQPRKDLYSNGATRIKDLSVSSSTSSSSAPSSPSMRRDELFFLFGAPLANSFVPLEYSLSHPNVPFFGSFPLIPLDHTIGADAADDSLDDEKPDDAIIATMVMDQWANFAKFGDPEGEKKEGAPSMSLTKKKKKLSSPSSSSPSSPSSSPIASSLSHQVSQPATSWPAFDLKNQLYLELNLEPKVKSHFNSYESSLISNLGTLMMIHETQWHERQLFKLNLLRKNNNKSDTHSRSHLLDDRNINLINSTIVNVNQLNGNNVDDESRVAFFKKFSLKFTDNLRPGLPAVATSNLGLNFASGSNNSLLLHHSSSPTSGGLNNLNNSSSAKTAILLTPEQSELSNTLSLAVIIGVTLFVLNVAVLGGVYCKIHVTRVKTRQQQQQQQQQQLQLQQQQSQSTLHPQLHHHHHHHHSHGASESMKYNSSYNLDSDGHCSSVNQLNVTGVNSEYGGGGGGGEIVDVTTATMAMTELAPDVNRMVDGSTVEVAAVTILESLDQSASYVSRTSGGAISSALGSSGGGGGSEGDVDVGVLSSSCTSSGTSAAASNLTSTSAAAVASTIHQSGTPGTLTTTIVPSSMSLASNVSSKKNSSSRTRSTSNRRVQVVKNCDYPPVQTYNSSSSSSASSSTKRHHHHHQQQHGHSHHHGSHLHFQPYINCSDQVTSDADVNELTLDALYHPLVHSSPSTGLLATSASPPPPPLPYGNNNSSQLGQMTVSTSILHDSSSHYPTSSASHHQNHVRFSPVISTSDCSPVSSLVSCSSASQSTSLHPFESQAASSSSVLATNGNCHLIPPPSLDSSSSGGSKNITFANSTATNGSYYGATYSQQHPHPHQHEGQQCHHSPYGPSNNNNNNGNGNNNCYLLPSGSSDEADGNNLTSMVTGSKSQHGHVEFVHPHQGAKKKNSSSNKSGNGLNGGNNFADQSSDTSSSGVSSMTMVNAVTAKCDLPSASSSSSSSFMHAVTYDGDNDHNDSSFTGITGHNNSTGKSGSNNRTFSDSCYGSISRVTDASEFKSQLHFDREHLINASMDTSATARGDQQIVLLQGNAGSDGTVDTCPNFSVSIGHAHHHQSHQHQHQHHLYSLNTSAVTGSSVSASVGGGDISMEQLATGQLMRNYCHLIPLSNVSLSEMSPSSASASLNNGTLTLSAIDANPGLSSGSHQHQMNPQVYTVTSASSQAFNSPSIAPSQLLGCQISTQSACEQNSPSHHHANSSFLSSSSSSSASHPHNHSHLHPHSHLHHGQNSLTCGSSSSSSSSSTSSTLSFSSSPSNCTECNSHAPVLTSGGVNSSVNCSSISNCNSSNPSVKGYKGPNLYSSSPSSLNNNAHFHLSTCDTSNGLGVIQEAPDEAHI